MELSLEAAARADVVVLIGGEDLGPAHYAGTAHYPGSGHHEPLADQAHLDVARYCLTSSTPLLGVGRGMQVINVALGGSLVPHLLTGDPHRGYGVQPFTLHQISLSDIALVGEVRPQQPVRCSHHQGIERLGEGLVVAARAKDGVIEAVVHASAPVTGVQWHPEHPESAMNEFGPLLRRLRRQWQGSYADSPTMQEFSAAG